MLLLDRCEILKLGASPRGLLPVSRYGDCAKKAPERRVDQIRVGLADLLLERAAAASHHVSAFVVPRALGSGRGTAAQGRIRGLHDARPGTAKGDAQSRSWDHLPSSALR